MSPDNSTASGDVVAGLRDLLAGAPGGADLLLPACIVTAFGVEAFGPAMTASLFARHAQPLSATPHVVQTATGLALFDTDAEGGAQALVADLYDGRVARLWRLGAVDGAEGGADSLAEPGLSPAYDPFLHQFREPVGLLASDHPDLDAAALPAVAEVAREAARAQAGAPARALVVRAFGAEGRAAALLAIHATTGALVRQPRCTLAAAAFRYGEDGAVLHRSVVMDAAAPPPRLDRLVGRAA